ncbi:MAG: TetR/AcrR family transcriptional regulator [Roseiarcus sp.]
MEVEAAMEGEAASGRARGAVRCGRPPRGLAGKVEERILDAAGHVFLERGFSGASVDEIAEAASAGKPTIYARFPGKQALFTAVVERLVRRNTSLEAALSCAGGSIEERLDALAAVILTRVLTLETIGLIRVAVAEARRFPDLATSVSRMGRERPTEAVARVFGELAASDGIGASPAFATEKLAETARRFLDLVVLPMLVRALFGEDLAALRAEIGPHAARSVAFFLAACGCAEAPAHGLATPADAELPASHGSVAG